MSCGQDIGADGKAAEDAFLDEVKAMVVQEASEWAVNGGGGGVGRGRSAARTDEEGGSGLGVGEVKVYGGIVVSHGCQELNPGRCGC